jgi:hypothetical protein
MTFRQILRDWGKLPRHPQGEPLRTSSGWQNFSWKLFAPSQRDWFNACREVVERKDRQELETWLNARDENKSALFRFCGQDRAAIMQVHLRCALAILDSQRWPLIRPEVVLQQMDETTEMPEGWLLDLIEELFAGKLRLSVPGRSVTIMTLLVEKRGADDSGVVADLTLELMPDGVGTLYPIPALAFVNRDTDFQQAEENACAMARATLASWGKAWQQDIRWQLQRRDGKPLSLTLLGDSAGGALTLELVKLLVGE